GSTAAATTVTPRNRRTPSSSSNGRASPRRFGGRELSSGSMRRRGAFYRLGFWIVSALIGCTRFAVSGALAIAIMAFVIVLGSQIFLFAPHSAWRPLTPEPP